MKVAHISVALGLLVLALGGFARAQDKSDALYSDKTQEQYTRKSITFIGADAPAQLGLWPEVLQAVERAIEPRIRLKRFEYNDLNAKAFGSLDDFINALREYVLKRADDRAGAEAQFSDRFKRANILARDIERIMKAAFLFRTKVTSYRHQNKVCRMPEKRKRKGSILLGGPPKCRTGDPRDWRDKPSVTASLGGELLIYQANLIDTKKPPAEEVARLGLSSSADVGYPAPPRPPDQPVKPERVTPPKRPGPRASPAARKRYDDQVRALQEARRIYSDWERSGGRDGRRGDRRRGDRRRDRRGVRPGRPMAPPGPLRGQVQRYLDEMHGYDRRLEQYERAMERWRQEMERHRLAMDAYFKRLPQLQDKARRQATMQAAGGIAGGVKKRIKKLEPFQLKAVGQKRPDGMDLMLGEAEGVKLDDAYDVMEFNQAGTKTLTGYVKVREVGRPLGSGEGKPSYAEKVREKRDFTGGEQLVEHPMSKWDVGFVAVYSMAFMDLFGRSGTLNHMSGGRLYVDNDWAETVGVPELYFPCFGLEAQYIGSDGQGSNWMIARAQLGFKKKWYATNVVFVLGLHASGAVVFETSGDDFSEYSGSSYWGGGGDLTLGFEFFFTPEFSLVLTPFGRYTFLGGLDQEIAAGARFGIRWGL